MIGVNLCMTQGYDAYYRSSFFSVFIFSMPNLSSDLFDLQPAFVPTVQSTPAISTSASSAWGGKLRRMNWLNDG